MWRSGLQDSLDSCAAAVHEFRIPPKALLGLHSYCPVHFDAFHAVLVDTTVHISLLKSSSGVAPPKVIRFVIILLFMYQKLYISGSFISLENWYFDLLNLLKCFLRDSRNIEELSGENIRGLGQVHFRIEVLSMRLLPSLLCLAIMSGSFCQFGCHFLYSMWFVVYICVTASAYSNEVKIFVDLRVCCSLLCLYVFLSGLFVPVLMIFCMKKKYKFHEPVMFPWIHYCVLKWLYKDNVPMRSKGCFLSCGVLLISMFFPSTWHERTLEDTLRNNLE